MSNTLYLSRFLSLISTSFIYTFQGVQHHTQVYLTLHTTVVRILVMMVGRNCAKPKAISRLLKTFRPTIQLERNPACAGLEHPVTALVKIILIGFCLINSKFSSGGGNHSGLNTNDVPWPKTEVRDGLEPVTSNPVTHQSISCNSPTILRVCNLFI